MRKKTKNTIKTITCNAALALNLSTFTNGQDSSGLGVEARHNGILQLVLASTRSKLTATAKHPIASVRQGTVREDSQMLMAGVCTESTWISTCLGGGVARAEVSLSGPEEFYRASGKWMPMGRIGASTPLMTLRNPNLTVSLEAAHFWTIRRTGSWGTWEWEKQTLRSQDSSQYPSQDPARPNLNLTGGNNSQVDPSAAEPPRGMPIPGAHLDGLTTIGILVSVRID